MDFLFWLLGAAICPDLGDLGSDRYAEREAATEAFRLAGPKAWPKLLLMSQSPDPEVVDRVESLLLETPLRQTTLRSFGVVWRVVADSNLDISNDATWRAIDNFWGKVPVVLTGVKWEVGDTTTSLAFINISAARRAKLRCENRKTLATIAGYAGDLTGVWRAWATK